MGTRPDDATTAMTRERVPASGTRQLPFKPFKQRGEFRLIFLQQRAHVFPVFLRPVNDGHESAPFHLPVVPGLPCCLSLTIARRHGTVVTAGTRPCYLLAVMRKRRAAGLAVLACRAQVRPGLARQCDEAGTLRGAA